MKKGAFIALVALFVAALGVVIGLAAYFKNRSEYLYDEEEDYFFDDADDLDYYDNEDDEDDNVSEIWSSNTSMDEEAN